jgi:hypothetical protein
MNSADSILEASRNVLMERARQRGLAYERSMSSAVDAANIMMGTSLNESDGYLFMALLKISRSRNGKPSLDDFVDAASYIALYGESVLSDPENDIDGDCDNVMDHRDFPGIDVDLDGDNSNIIHLDFGNDRDALDDFMKFLESLNHGGILN